jgi:hypothetical protein
MAGLPMDFLTNLIPDILTCANDLIKKDLLIRFSYLEENLSQNPTAMVRPLRIEYPGAISAEFPAPG